MNQLLFVEEKPKANSARQPALAPSPAPPMLEPSATSLEPPIDERARRRIYYRALSQFLTGFNSARLASKSPSAPVSKN